MQMKFATTLLVLGSMVLSAYSQTPLAKVFADMKNSDPATVQKAKDNIALTASQEMPTIEKDASVLCNALADPDPFIRLQATGILVSIVVAAPTHNSVVLACKAGLIAAAAEPGDQTRNNALFALALNPAGPPAEAQDVFVAALKSPNLRTAEVGAAGLLKENGGANQANHKLVESALLSAPDARHRLNLLYAISGSAVPSDVLFQASQRYLYDSDPSVQQVSIDAVAATGTDKGKIIAVLQNFEDSPSATVQSKTYARAVLDRIHSAQ